MQVNEVFSYIYYKLKDNNQINIFDYEEAATKTQKVLYMAELMHRILFNKPLITDAEYVCLKNGPAIGTEYLDYSKAIQGKLFNNLNDNDKAILDACLKKWILETSTEELIAITHKDNDNIPLEAWKMITARSRYGTEPINDEMLNKDAQIFKDNTLDKYNIFKGKK